MLVAKQIRMRFSGSGMPFRKIRCIYCPRSVFPDSVLHMCTYMAAKYSDLNVFELLHLLFEFSWFCVDF